MFGLSREVGVVMGVGARNALILISELCGIRIAPEF